MDIINLGETDGLPPLNWAIVLEKLDAGLPGGLTRFNFSPAHRMLNVDLSRADE